MAERSSETDPSKRTRLALFANFFKGYMSVSAVVAASIPIPVTSWKLIPIYAQQRGFLTVYASMFCFLLLAFVFSIRHRLARAMFFKSGVSGTVAALPAVFIVFTLGCVIAYHGVLQRSLAQLREVGFSTNATKDLLEQIDVTQIPYAVELAACYLGIFIFAELAFVMMAMREYLQDVLRLDEVALLRGTARVGRPFPAEKRWPGTMLAREATPVDLLSTNLRSFQRRAGFDGFDHRFILGKYMIPAHLRTLFWDTDADEFAPEAHPDYTIFRVLELGDDAAVHWLRETFPESEIRRVLQTEGRLSKKSANFWALVYGILPAEVASLNGGR